ncbi:unnamed protein product [Leptosia nina]|uniref:Uncharacterized protein n=1 Tax=Leptosia nina TaxID=320188 RepID=A0AAV1JQT0_9NEOP
MDLRVLVWFSLFALVACSGNESVPDTSGSKDNYRPSGTLASIGRMFIDIPLGFVEALKDAAEAIESVAVALVKGVFS